MKVRENYNRHARGPRATRTAQHRLHLNACKSALLGRISKKGSAHAHANFACGRGQDALKILHTFSKNYASVKVHNFDFSDLCLEEFQNRVEKHPLNAARNMEWLFHCQDLTTWQCSKAEEFDSSSCFLAFHYLNNSESFLENAAKSLKSGASMCLVFPDSDFILEQMEKAIKNCHDKNDYYSFGKSDDSKHLFNILFSYDRYCEFKGGAPELQYYFSLEGSIDDVPENVVVKQKFIEDAKKHGFEVSLCENAASYEIPDELANKMRIDKTRRMTSYEKFALSLYLCVVITKL